MESRECFALREIRERAALTPPVDLSRLRDVPSSQPARSTAGPHRPSGLLRIRAERPTGGARSTGTGWLLGTKIWDPSGPGKTLQ